MAANEAKYTPGEMGPCLRPVLACGAMWGPAKLRGYERPCYRCGTTITRGTLAYSPMGGGDRGRRLHVECALAFERSEAEYRAAIAKAEGR